MSKLTDKQIEKYSRQIIIEKIGLSGQKKILNSSICIVGCGGLGSSAAIPFNDWDWKYNAYR